MTRAGDVAGRGGAAGAGGATEAGRGTVTAGMNPGTAVICRLGMAAMGC